MQLAPVSIRNSVVYPSIRNEASHLSARRRSAVVWECDGDYAEHVFATGPAVLASIVVSSIVVSLCSWIMADNTRMARACFLLHTMCQWFGFLQ